MKHERIKNPPNGIRVIIDRAFKEVSFFLSALSNIIAIAIHAIKKNSNNHSI